jgi:hypothetical protein
MTASNFQQIITHLAEAQVEYIVIGGVAATIHGSAYVTYDLDICYERSLANIERLCRMLAPLHPVLRDVSADLPFHIDPRAVLAGLNFTLNTDLGAVDLLGEVSPFGPFAAVLPYAETAVLFGRDVRVLSLEGLIKAKQAAGRRKDLLVLPELEALLELKKRSSLP